jgi:glycosyltransferase involved in cell wall biosynthesis
MKYKISTVIPLYNAEKYIKRTLESVLIQTRLPDEIIIIDDGSKDNGPNIARETLESHKFKNFRIITTPNRGHASAANTGVREACGDYVALVDSDDTWEKEKLKKVSDYLEMSTKPAEILFSKFTFIDEYDQLYHRQNKNQEFHPEKFWQRLIVEGNLVYGSNSGVIIKRQAFLSENGYDENLRACEDWDFWIRLAKKFDFNFFPESLVNIRVHRDNQSGDKKLMMNYHLAVIAKHREDIKAQGIDFIDIIKMILMQQGKKIFYFYFSNDYKPQRYLLEKITDLRLIRTRTFFPTIMKMCINTFKRICKF